MVGREEKRKRSKKTAGRKNPPDFRSPLKPPIETNALRNARYYMTICPYCVFLHFLLFGANKSWDTEKNVCKERAEKYRTKQCQAEPSRAEPSRAEPSRAELN
ncbi:hypothetical protein ALC57_09831 [Trachymyrmex cornetzi]|uniref:Uncharacterized protein n=1 Tax=Trachymyrmex cornetzi TaxID=471704 RepID=A0A195DZ93_9HYME|nr:hypothetical protein ALC57_09831 [Trachymyrmex cornetzi]